MKAGENGHLVRPYPTINENLLPPLYSLNMINKGESFICIAERTEYDPINGKTSVFRLLKRYSKLSEMATDGNKIPDVSNLVYSPDGSTVALVGAEWVRIGEFDKNGQYTSFANPVNKKSASK